MEISTRKEMDTKQTKLKTPYQLEKEAKDLAIYNEYNELMAQEGAMATAVEQHLMKKYNIYAKSTIWFIRQRVEERLKKEKANGN